MVFVRAELNPRRIIILTRQRLFAHTSEHFAGIFRPRRRPHEQHQSTLRLPRLVHRRNHVVQGGLVENLRLVIDDNINLVEAAAEACRTGAEHDPRPVTEVDLFLTRAQDNFHDVWCDPLALRKSLHLLEGLFGGSQSVRRPHDGQPGTQ